MKGIPTLRFAGLALLAAAALGFALAGSETRAVEPGPVYSATVGDHTYTVYCANCHGLDGRGKGEVAPTLTAKPTDLTRLAATNNGVFPTERVREVIDGRADIAAHGTREMPVWGELFLWPGKDSPERREQVERKIGDLIAYLSSIQEPAEKH